MGSERLTVGEPEADCELDDVRFDCAFVDVDAAFVFPESKLCNAEFKFELPAVCPVVARNFSSFWS